MIVKMKEILLFTLSSRVEETVQELGELGVIEMREVKEPSREKVEQINEKVKNTKKAVDLLENYIKKNNNDTERKQYSSVDPERIVNRIMISGNVKKQCQKRLGKLKKDLKWYEIWGENIDIKDIKYLQDKDIYIRLYLVDKIELATIPKDLSTVAFPERENMVPMALFARSSSEKLNFHEETLPSLRLLDVNQQIVRKERQLEEVDNFLSDQTDSIALLCDYQNYLEDRLNTRKVLEGMGDIGGSIKYLRGFIPTESVEKFKRKVKQKEWGYQITEPKNPDEVPVYIKNPKWVSIINPVMKFIDIVPGYREVDVSIYFLVAFALFFAMLVGDAGYGAIFLVCTFLFRNKLSAQMRFLIYLLCGTTIIWGVLSGTYFGSEQIAAMPFFNNLIIPEIASFGVDNISFMMHLSFLIGAIHLTIAHGIRVFQFINSIKALSEVGWIAFVWGLFFVAENVVLGKPLPEWNSWLFLVGATLVIFFSKEGKSFFGSMGSSLANLPLNLINGFSDIVSYVRLFAVGMATATVASSFNNMILPEGVNLSFLDLLMAIIALLLGHGLNIVLALMAVMVHGIRLNMLEFAGHLGVQFSGEAFKPFILNSSRKKEED